MAFYSSTQLANNTHSKAKTSKELNAEKVLETIRTPPYQNYCIQVPPGFQMTTCFVLGMLNRVNPELKAPQVLCVCSTKESAKQNQEFFKKNDRSAGITSLRAVWHRTAASIRTRSEAVNEQVILGTPGIIKTWMSRGILKMENINTVVFYEADNMLAGAQGGYKDDSVRIIKGIRKSRGDYQILLFSATCDENMENFATKQIINAKKIVISQYWVKFPNVSSEKQMLVSFLKKIELAEKPCQAIIWAKTRQTAVELHKKLEEEMKYNCFVENFGSGLTKILIDFQKSNSGQPQVNFVFNFDLQYPPSGLYYEQEVVFNFYIDQDEQAMHSEQKVPELILNGEEDVEDVLNDEMKKFSNMF